MKWKYIGISVLASAIMCTALGFGDQEEHNVDWITPEQLQAMLFTTDMTIIDVRLDVEWLSSNEKIIGAVWENFKEVDRWVGNYPRGKVTVVY